MTSPEMRRFLPAAVATLALAGVPFAVLAQDGAAAWPPEAVPADASVDMSPATTGTIPDRVAPVAVRTFPVPKRMKAAAKDDGPWCRSGISVGTGAGFCLIN